MYNMHSTIQSKNSMNWLYCWRASALDSMNGAYSKLSLISLNSFLRFWNQCDWFCFNILKYPLRIGSARVLRRLFSTMRPNSIFKKQNVHPISFNTCPSYSSHKILLKKSLKKRIIKFGFDNMVTTSNRVWVKFGTKIRRMKNLKIFTIFVIHSMWFRCDIPIECLCNFFDFIYSEV